MTGSRSRAGVALLLAAGLVLAACGGDDAAAPDRPTTTTTETPPADTDPVEPRADPQVSVVAEGLEAPWDLAFLPRGRVLVTERDSGRLLEIGPGGTVEEVQRFDVDAAGEGGLLGLAPSPDFVTDGLVYAYLTTAEDNRIVRFRPGDEPEVVLAGIPSARIHNGGRIAFGPDGMLYAGTGDAASPPRSQDTGSLAGKVLRMTPDGEPPEDSPFGSVVHAYGFRNVQGLTWDAAGRLYAAELGPDVDDEIHLVQPGGNHGWPEVTGVSGRADLVDPVAVRQPPVASWSGAGILLGPAAGEWQDDLFVAALRGERLWRFHLDGDGAVVDDEELFVGEYGRLRQAIQAPDGSLWLLTTNRDGRGTPGPDDDRILRVLPPGTT